MDFGPWNGHELPKMVYRCHICAVTSLSSPESFVRRSRPALEEKISLRIPKDFQDPKSTVRKLTRASRLTKPSRSEIVLSASLHRDEKEPESRVQDPEMSSVKQTKILSPRILDRKSEAAPLSKQSECHHPRSRVHALLVHVKGGQKSKIQDPRSDSSRSPCKRRS